jgi:hypothetical protein
MPAAEGETQPELLKLMRAGSLPAELKPNTNEARLHGLLDGQIPPAMAGSDPQGEVYRELVLASCRSYHQLLPELFEGLDDASELLLPDDLLSEGSIAGGFRSAISDEDCRDVEIIGWLYQFYISEKKDQVIGKVVKSEDIPAATQLFTPNWIVKYMVQNSLGATWLATYPDSPIKNEMQFYIEPVLQTHEVNNQLKVSIPIRLNPQELKFIDPACGSGHILAEAYELFKAFYLEAGYQLREIPQQVLQNNLFGLDIDERAAQLASFLLLMKGRSDDRRLLERGVRLNIIALKNSRDFQIEPLISDSTIADYGVSHADLDELKILFEDASTFGSLVQVPQSIAKKLPLLKQLCAAPCMDMLGLEAQNSLAGLVLQADLLAAKYDVVVANPPYIGIKYHTAEMKEFLKRRYQEYTKDLFAVFIKRCLQLCGCNGRIGLMTPQVWMFLSSYEGLRKDLVERSTITTLIHPEYNAFWDSAHVAICTFTLTKKHLEEYEATFIRLAGFYGADLQPVKVLEALKKPDCGWLHTTKVDSFKEIPGSPIAFWHSERLRSVFQKGRDLGELADIRAGMACSNNNRFLRYWHEISFSKSIISLDSTINSSERHTFKWYPYNKGGAFRRWYGRMDYLINWMDDGKEIKDWVVSNPNDPGTTHWSRRIPNSEYFFRECLTWGEITSDKPSFRYLPQGFVIGNKGPGIFSSYTNLCWLGFLNSKFCGLLFALLNPTVTLNVGNVSKIPIVDIGHNETHLKGIDRLTKLSSEDWDAFERSWSFMTLGLLSKSLINTKNLEGSYASWISRNKLAIAEMKQLEEENNRIFADAYRVASEIDCEVPLDEITLTVNPSYRYGSALSEKEQWARFRKDTIADFISYSAGCMMGRYSLDHPGLILADARESQAEQLAAYEEKVGKPMKEVQFKPDPDGIIPVLDGEWFEDDIVARTREFLAVTFPESTVNENLRFIEESLGKDIRKYFCSEFYKDHLQTYKKRPIYWLVQSPRKGFACLIYLHRYTKDTLNQVLNNYFRPYLQKLEARLAQLGLDQLNDDLPTRERTAARKEAEKITKMLKECQAWEQDALLPLAQQRIELDLDDGVKVNYLKLQDVLATIPGLAAKED